MKVVVNNNVYEMGKKTYKGVLEAAGQQVPFGIYAVEKSGICELRKDKCRDEKELNLLIADYVKNGFKVYANRRRK